MVILLQCILSIFPASVHQFYVNILVFVNIHPFLYINDQFALFNICTFFDLLKYPLLTIDHTKNEMNTITPARTHYKWTKISSLEIDIFGFKMMMKRGLEIFILKFTKPLQSCCCPVPKNLPRNAELAWQVSRYLWRGSVNFKIKKI